MRRKIMTAFVCAIMTISVIPVYADDTQTDQAVTTEVFYRNSSNGARNKKNAKERTTEEKDNKQETY